MPWKKLGLLLIALSLVALAAGCGDDDDTKTVDQFEIVRQAFDNSLTLSSGAPPVTKSTTLFAELNDTNPDNRPFVVSVRSAEHYAIGHVPGAVNIPWRTIADPANLATLPTNKTIVVYCYTGHTGQIGSTVLRALGYDAVNMKFGIMAWTKDATVRVASPFSDPPQDYPTETTAHALPAAHDLPTLDVTTSTDPDEIVRAAAEKYVTTYTPVITAEAVYTNLNDGNPDNDYFVVSVRKPEDYAKGHVPGAVNIPWTTIAKKENLERLPTDKKIVVYCYTGHTGQIAATVLGSLGYDVVNMKFGIMAWTTDPTVRVASPFSEDDWPDYATESGSGS